MLEAIGFRRLRSGKGDHTIYARGTERVVIDGGPNHEIPMPVWRKLRREFDLEDKR
jgi:predicted RNA binding protein YcfA (HicA-like mRNA interferase family)